MARHRWKPDEIDAIREQLLTLRTDVVAALIGVHPKALRSALRRKGVSIRWTRAAQPQRADTGVMVRRPSDGYAAATYGAEALVKLKEGRCRWPFGDPAEPNFHFCGRHVFGPGQSYCKAHKRQSVE